MSRVRIAQLLCPQRHCFLARPYESPDGEAIPAVAHRLKGIIAVWAKVGWIPQCLICRAESFHTADDPTPWETIEQAAPHLAERAKQAAAENAFFRASRG